MTVRRSGRRSPPGTLALARAAQAGQQVTDCDPGGFAAGGFGAAGYPDAGGLPDGAVRASLGCGNPVAVADLRPGETVLDLGCGGGIDVLLSARRVGPAGTAYGLDMTDGDAGPGPGPRAAGRRGQRRVPPRPDRGDPAAGQLGGRDHLQLRDQPVNRPGRRVRRDLPGAAPRRPPGHLRHPGRGRPHPGPADRARRARWAASPGFRPSPSTAPGWPRRASPALSSPRRTRSPAACTRRSSARPGPDPCQPRAHACGSRR